MRSDAAQSPTLPSDLTEAVEAAVDRKAHDLVVLDLSGISDFTEYFLICSGTNERQVQAISDGVVRRLKDAGLRPISVEGYRQGRWVLIDYGSFLAHVFDDRTRAFYRLESLWSDGRDVTPELGPVGDRVGMGDRR